MRDNITAALKDAMKARDARRISTLRLMMAAIKDRDIAARSEDRCEGASQDEILQVLTKMVRQREESIKTYEDAGRADLAEQEREEKAIIEGFLPRQLTSDEIKAACGTVVQEIGACGLKDMGRCMGTLKERYAGQMDFGRASAIVKTMLAS
ncbi:MAG: GatB/YqeY domain-containing protein [Alphaproteobacteria bacterium]|nr:GatB/YqeY domain-containing protein [Alphaproteobacteria bacterium]